MTRVASLCVLLPLMCCVGSAQSALTPADIAGGWKSLFDGKSTAAWRGYKKDAFPAKGWSIDDGCIKCSAGGGGGDIVTVDEYADFELMLEFKIAKGSNSGIMYRVAEKHDAPWQTGPEYQIIDDGGYKDPLQPGQMSGAIYDLYPPSKPGLLKPTGEFNAVRIRLRDNVLQHWLNGEKVAEVRTDSPEWKEKIAASKFAKMEGFGVLPKGRIALQDHGNDVWFRNIRVRDLSAPLPNEVRLFNGKDLKGWTAFVDGKTEDAWSVADGVLVCRGNPIGYIRTEADYTNFVLMLEWRFSPVTKKAGNSGVLLRVQPPDKVWPKSVEAQLQSENAGDFWNIDEFPMKTDASRLSGRNTKKTHAAERPIGEWNEYEIIVDHGTITLKVNGEVLNAATEVAELAGKIALQSEGAEIHFQNVRLSPLK